MRIRKPLTITLATASLASIMLLGGCNKEEATDEGTASSDIAPTVMPASNETVLEIDVKGMTCTGCSGSVQTALENLEGVSYCNVSLEENKATVHITDATTVDAVLAAIPEKFETSIHDGSGHDEDHDGHDHDDHDEHGHG